MTKNTRRKTGTRTTPPQPNPAPVTPEADNAVTKTTDPAAKTGQGPQANDVDPSVKVTESLDPAINTAQSPEADQAEVAIMGDGTTSTAKQDAEELAQVQDSLVADGVPAPEEDRPKNQPHVGDISGKKSVPTPVINRQAKEDGARVPPSENRRPPMNPFMRQAAERQAKSRQRVAVTPEEMDEKINALGIKTEGNFLFTALISHMNDYVATMSPNTPISDAIGARKQMQLANDIFSALEASPQESAAALKIIELYFTEYAGQALSRRHVFRFMDKVTLEQQKALAFQGLLHLFVELGNKGDRTRKEIAREVSIRKIADYMTNNTDAQIRLTEFMS